MQVTNPWSLETISLFMCAKYYEERTILSKVALSTFLRKRMTYEQLCRAMSVALHNPSREWALLIRLALARMSSAARRSCDMRSVTYRSMCTHITRSTLVQNPWMRALANTLCLKEGPLPNCVLVCRWVSAQIRAQLQLLSR